MILENIKGFLDDRVERYNEIGFIKNDPISIPHLFKNQQDIEIMGLWTSILTWGLRKTTIQKAKDLIKCMDEKPYDFILNHSENDLKNFKNFKHRTFNLTDTLYFIQFFKYHYQENSSLESAFFMSKELDGLDFEPERNLNAFKNYFFSLEDLPQRTRKHISSPISGSTVKRINMFLRWMVRKDEKGVDFGIWNRIKPKDLMIPLDIHVERVSKKLGLLTRKQRDWKSVKELTLNLKSMDPLDPIKYDFALFNLGIEENF